MRLKKTIITLSFFTFILSGCASSLKVIVGKEKLVRIPQIVAHLEPSLERDKFQVLGKIILQNPSESDLSLGKINLIIQDESGNILSQIDASWQRERIKSKELIQAPVKFSLPIEVLNKDLIQVTLNTNLLYKKLNVQLPIRSKIAVLHLKSFRNSISGPMSMLVYTKLHSDILGNASLEYSLDITNPFNVDVAMEEANLKIYTKEKPQIGKISLAKTLLVSKKQTRINGVIKLQKFFSTMIIQEFASGHPIRIQLSGNLRIPKTDISIPFTLESIQEVDFSLFPKLK